MLVLGTAGQAADDPVVARLSGQDVHLSSLQPLLDGFDAATRAEARRDPRVLATLVRSELGRRAVLEKAARQHWADEPRIVREIARARDGVVVSSWLAANAAVPAGYPSAAELQAAYDRDRERFVTPRQYRLEQIFVPRAPGTAPGEALRGLGRAAARPAADLSALAAGFANQVPGTGVADLGWVSETKVQPDILQSIKGLQIGEVSEPLATPDGWHIIRLKDTRPATLRSLAEVTPALTVLLRQQRQHELETRLVQDLLEQDGTTISETALAAALGPS